MPEYDYRCPVCCHRWTEVRSMAQRAKAHCPECGHPAERRWDRAPSVQAFRPFYHHNLCPHPVKVNSTRELKDLAKKHNVRVEQ